MQLFAILASLTLALPAWGQDARPAAPLPPSILSALIQPGGTLGRTMAMAQPIFRDLDADGNGGLDKADVAFGRAVAAARMRTSTLTQIMSADLDGDGAVTEAELLARQRHDRRRNEPLPTGAANAQAAGNAAQIREFMAADLDKDGRITAEEAMKLGTERAAKAEAVSRGADVPLREVLDYAGTEPLTYARFADIVTELFRATDTDGNGTISQDELAALRQRSEDRQRIAAAGERQRKLDEARAGCTLPRPSEAAQVLLLSAYEGNALSSVTIGSQDIEVRTASIAVEAGDGPLYVVAVSHRPMIWRFTGAVDRLERVVLTSQSNRPNGSRADARPTTGATGLPAEKFVFLPRPACLPAFWEHPSIQSAQTVAIVRGETGKAPLIATRYAVSGITIPSMTLAQAEGRQDASPGIVIERDGKSFAIDMSGTPRMRNVPGGLESEVARFFPGGVVEIDVANVVASEQPVRYEVLPSQAGLLQLMRSGALGRNTRGEFLIREKIRFPPGLYGAHSARFLLLDGVPPPDGDPGHSCVVSEATGKALSGTGIPC